MGKHDDPSIQDWLQSSATLKKPEPAPSRSEQGDVPSDVPDKPSGDDGTMGADGTPNRSNQTDSGDIHGLPRADELDASKEEDSHFQATREKEKTKRLGIVLKALPVITLSVGGIILYYLNS
ncbi:MAG: hypothetical protein GDA52_10395 [Rhodobacteraceae bacterium]|nr:hypothetical protein [Paracoccaceae bacterium]